jgi:hypothetical protein
MADKQEIAELISERSPTGRRLDVLEYLLGWRAERDVGWTSWLEALKLANGDVALECDGDGHECWVYCRDGELMMAVNRDLRDKPLFEVVFKQIVNDGDTGKELVWADSTPVDGS